MSEVTAPMPSDKFLAGMKTYLYSGIVVLLMFATIWWGPLKMNEGFSTKVIVAIADIVLFVAGKAVASKAVDAFKKFKGIK